MFRDTITRLFVALTGLLIMYLVYTKVMETRTEFVDNEWHLNGDAKEGNTLPDNVNVSSENPKVYSDSQLSTIHYLTNQFMPRVQ